MAEEEYNLDEALEELLEGVTVSKSSKTTVQYNDNVELSEEQLKKLRMAKIVVEATKPKIESMKKFFKSEHWNDIIKDISKDDDTKKYLLRNTKTAFGESVRAIEQIEKIVAKYLKE